MSNDPQPQPKLEFYAVIVDEGEPAKIVTAHTYSDIKLLLQTALSEQPSGARQVFIFHGLRIMITPDFRLQGCHLTSMYLDPGDMIVVDDSLFNATSVLPDVQGFIVGKPGVTKKTHQAFDDPIDEDDNDEEPNSSLPF